MRSSTSFVLFILCVFQILYSCYGVYTVPVYKEHDSVCFDKIYSFIDHDQNVLCKRYKVYKLFVCVSDMVFGWFVNGAKKVFDCLKDDKAIKQIQIAELIPPKEIETEEELDQLDQPSDVREEEKNIIKKRRPLTNNRRLRSKNKDESKGQSFLEKAFNLWGHQPPPPKTKTVPRNVNMPVQTPHKLVNKISFRNVDLKKCYNLFLGAHLMTIFIATYKFLRSFYRWSPLNFYEIVLRNITFNVESRRVDVATEANDVDIDTDSDESDMEDLIKYNRRSKLNHV
ncbi:uncharacterized protein LOC108743055 isoform X2 [Agrilus planipennis]|uniref:Uncharacterized protein LOC108743055 isoform X2 n=1 Tax=Agrilus planipennis TaxID=224129 RepID=A0A1W4XNK2_AGRPL|nr:uncharacterized protein LOC108743055 isoform X2 [Agrilus planipennis]